MKRQAKDLALMHLMKAVAGLTQLGQTLHPLQSWKESVKVKVPCSHSLMAFFSGLLDDLPRS
jgi:hypothetical protein